MPRKLITFDWAIKKLLRSKANFGILEGFLSELLFTDITIVEILESESNKETEDNKYNRVDIKVKDASGQLILVEIQHTREYDFVLRMLPDTEEVIPEHVRSGNSFSGISKVISVNIIFFDFHGSTDYIYHGATTFEGIHTHQILQLSEKQRELLGPRKIADLCPEYYIIDVKSFDNVVRDALDQWIYFLKNTEIKESFFAKGLAEAKEKLAVLAMSDAELQVYEAFEYKLHHRASLYEGTFVLGKIEGRMEARIEAEIEGKEEVARAMRRKGIPVSTISEVTGFAVEEIERMPGDNT